MVIASKQTRKRVARLATCLVLLGPAAGLLGAQASAAAEGPAVATGATGLGRSMPMPGNSSALNAVSCPSANNCWAVGDYGIASGSSFSLNDALRWDGSLWSQAVTPNPGGTVNGDGNELAGIRCPTSALCWAAGKAETTGSPDVNEALRWNGTTWSTG